MRALVWEGKYDIKLREVPKPMITDATDAIVKITTASICGSDLHLYRNEIPGNAMHRGDIVGHEGMGIVEEVGPHVRDIKPGDRVVISCIIAEGNCWYCKQGLYSLCDLSNPCQNAEAIAGYKLSGVFGYTHLTGGFAGCQADYVRVPYADTTLLRVPSSLPDEKLVLLSDALCTGWHACELGQVSPGQTVAVWGCGPVGLLAQMWAKYRGAARVIGIDHIPSRLQIARDKIGSDVINYDEIDPLEALRALCPGGPDVCIEAAGYRYSKSLTHKIQRAIGIEVDTPEILTEAIKAVRKAGTVAVVGAYFQNANQFPIGILMEKGITLRGSQVFVQRYWKHLLSILEKGEIDPTFIITHVMPLSLGSEAYKMFDEKLDSCEKVLLKPDLQPAASY